MARREPLHLTSIWVLFVLVLFVWHDQCNWAQHPIFNIGFKNSKFLDQVGMLFPESRTGHLFRPPVLLIGTTVEQEASPGKCVLLSTSEATGRRTKYWAISSGDKSWAVRVDVRDLGGHLDVTRRAHIGTLATWVTSASSHANMVSALPFRFLGFFGLTRSK